jgi:type II secretory pathway component PulK
LNARAKQRGVAVLIAMLVVTVGTIIAVNLMWEGTLDLRRAESALAADQGLMYVQGAEAWAADILRQDIVDSPDTDNLSEAWAFELPPPARRRRHDYRQARRPSRTVQLEQFDRRPRARESDRP